MADKKISQLTGATTPLAGTEVLPIVQSGSTVKVSSDDLTVKNVRSNATSGILQISGPAAATTRVMTTPNANFTAARTDAAQTFTGDQVFSNNVGIGATTIGAQNKLHVRYSAVAGATYFSSSPLIVERSDVNLVSLLSADGTDQGFLFGDASDNDIGGLFYIHGSDAMAFRTNTTEQVRISSAGNVTLNTGNLIVGTAGKGIDFSATAGTGTSELLADYEEGVWTPTLTDATNNATMGANNFGQYTKIGRLVVCQMYVETTSLGSITAGSAVYVSGWPFAIGKTGGAVASQASGLAIGANQSMTLRPWASTVMRLAKWDATTGTTEIVASEWSADGAMYITVSYEV